MVLSLGLLGPQESLEMPVVVVLELGDTGVSGSPGEGSGNGGVGGALVSLRS